MSSTALSESVALFSLSCHEILSLYSSWQVPMVSSTSSLNVHGQSLITVSLFFFLHCFCCRVMWSDTVVTFVYLWTIQNLSISCVDLLAAATVSSKSKGVCYSLAAVFKNKMQRVSAVHRERLISLHTASMWLSTSAKDFQIAELFKR